MAQDPWSAWMQGLGKAPTSNATKLPLTGYSPLTGNDAPRTPMNYRPNLGNRRDSVSGAVLDPLKTSAKGAWYQDIPQIAFSDFISPENSDWFRREYATTHGMGEQTERALGRFSPVAQYWLAALGQDKKFGPGVAGAPQKQADLTGQFYNRLLGKQDGPIDPKGIMKRVVSAEWNAKNPGKNDYIANLIAGPGQDADTQIRNFWSFVNGTVGRLMPSDTMGAYQSLIEREGNLYKDFMAKNPTMSMGFNKWIQQRLGPTGGL